MPPAAPMFSAVVPPKALMLVAPELRRANPVDVVVILLRILGLSWNTSLLDPVVSVMRPRN